LLLIFGLSKTRRRRIPAMGLQLRSNVAQAKNQRNPKGERRIGRLESLSEFKDVHGILFHLFRRDMPPFFAQAHPVVPGLAQGVARAEIFLVQIVRFDKLGKKALEGKIVGF